MKNQSLSPLHHWLEIKIDFIEDEVKDTQTQGEGRMSNQSNYYLAIDLVTFVLSDGVLGLNTLCRGYSSYTTFVGLLYPGKVSVAP